MWDIEMAKLFKDRDNKSSIGNTIGKVISEKPLKISILDSMAILEKNELYKCKHIYNHYYDAIKGTDMFIGDEVLLIPTENEQTFFIVDKIEKVGD